MESPLVVPLKKETYKFGLACNNLISKKYDWIAN